MISSWFQELDDISQWIPSLQLLLRPQYLKSSRHYSLIETKKEDVLHVDNIQLPVQAATSQKIEKKKQNK